MGLMGVWILMDYSQPAANNSTLVTISNGVKHKDNNTPPVQKGGVVNITVSSYSILYPGGSMRPPIRAPNRGPVAGCRTGAGYSS